MKTLIVLSGGADSATLAYYMKGAGHELEAVSFDYGQRHKREIESAIAIAGDLGINHQVVLLPGLGKLLKGSALTDDAVAVPHGHYEEETMRQTVVPNRNTIMLSIAWGIACAGGFDLVALGIHAGDHFIYPDCRPAYLVQINAALRAGTEGHRKQDLRLEAPFLHLKKADIIGLGLRMGVPYERTWTCYEGGGQACGKCGSCRERVEAFQLAGAQDPLAA